MDQHRLTGLQGAFSGKGIVHGGDGDRQAPRDVKAHAVRHADQAALIGDGVFSKARAA